MTERSAAGERVCTAPVSAECAAAVRATGVRDRRAGVKGALVERVVHAGFTSQRVLSSLELGLAKERSDCVNADGAAVAGGAAQYDSPPASPSYSPQPSPERSDDDGEPMETWFPDSLIADSLIRLRAGLIADHMVRIVALDELFAGIDIVVAQMNDAAASAPPVTAATGPVGQVATPEVAVVPYTETQVSLALSQIEASSSGVAAEVPAEDPAEWSAEDDDAEDDDGEDDDGEHDVLDDVVEQDNQRQILEGRAVRTTGETLEQLASAGVYPEWDDVYGHAEWMLTCGGLYAQDDDFVVSRLLEAHSRV